MLCNLLVRTMYFFLKKTFFFAHENMTNPPQKVAYLSRYSIVSEIFHSALQCCQTAQLAEFMFQNVVYRATVYRTGISMKDVRTR